MCSVNNVYTMIICALLGTELCKLYLSECQRLETWLSCYVECHHGNASLNVGTAAPNLIKALHNLFRRPQLQTKSFPIPYFN